MQVLKIFVFVKIPAKARHIQKRVSLIRDTAFFFFLAREIITERSIQRSKVYDTTRQGREIEPSWLVQETQDNSKNTSWMPGKYQEARDIMPGS